MSKAWELNEIFCKDSKYCVKSSSKLRHKIIKHNLIPYICDICSNNGIWNNKNLSLQVDHINGDPYDHRLDNLRFLCPNCHTQTDNYGSKNIGKGRFWKIDRYRKRFSLGEGC